MNWYPRYTGDYSRDTAHLSLVEHGAYNMLLDHYYATGNPLPESIESLMRVCRAFDQHEKDAVRTIADKYFPVHEDGLRHNKKADLVISQQSDKSAKRSCSGTKGAESKWGEQRNKQKRSERLANARLLGTHTSDEWALIVEWHDSKCCKCGAECDGGPVKDHIKPIYQGGSDAIENIQPLCRSCNAAKGPEAHGSLRDAIDAIWKEVPDA